MPTIIYISTLNIYLLYMYSDPKEPEHQFWVPDINDYPFVYDDDE